MRLSLCLIVRDEAEFLGGCLDSAKAQVDEIVVADTGSVDGTQRIAASFGARVITVPWNQDFAAARNASLAEATGDFALVLDADERLATGDTRARLESFVAESGTRVGRVEIVNDPGGTRTWVSRFLPLDGRHRFEGRVHEQILCDGAVPQRGETGVLVTHLGYSAEVLRSRDKSGRNRALLELELAERPEDAYLWYQLGRTWFGAGQMERARAALERALVLGEPDAPYAANMIETLCYALRALDRSTEALRLIEPFAAAYDERADTQFLAALLAMDLGHIERARRGYRRCLELAGSAPSGGEYDPAASSVAPAHNLGVLAEVLGRPEEAKAWYTRALGFEPLHASSRAGLARVELSAHERSRS